jgi:hypothetical protein
MGKRFTEEERMEAVKAYRDGATLDEVAGKFGVSTGAIWNWLNAAGFGARDRKASRALSMANGHGAFRGQAVYDQVESMYREGKSAATVAGELGVLPSFVQGVVRRAGIMRNRCEAAQLVSDKTSRRMRKYAVNEGAFDGAMDARLAWALGVIFGDGWIVRANGEINGVGVCGAEDVVRKVHAILGSEHPLVNRDGCFVSHITSRKLAHGIMRWGVVPAKSRVMEWPTDLVEDLEPHFLRGVFDADGWVGKDFSKPVLGIGLVAESFVESIADRIGRVCGKRPTIYVRKAKIDSRADSHEILLRGRRAVQFGRWLWEGSTSEMRGNCKYEKFALLSVQ